MRPPPHIGLSRAIRELRAPDSDREEVEGDVLKCPDWIYSHAELETQQALIRFRVRKLERERGFEPAILRLRNRTLECATRARKRAKAHHCAPR